MKCEAITIIALFLTSLCAAATVSQQAILQVEQTPEAKYLALFKNVPQQQLGLEEEIDPVKDYVLSLQATGPTDDTNEMVAYPPLNHDKLIQKATICAPKTES